MCSGTKPIGIRPPILRCQLKRVATQFGVAVFYHLFQKLECIPALFALAGGEIRAPLFRHVLEEARVLNGSGLPAQHRDVLRPIVDLLLVAVAAPELGNDLVVVVELNVVKEDLGLNGLARERRGKAVAVGVHGSEAVLVHSERGVAEHREGISGHLQQLRLVLLPQVVNPGLVDVMRPVAVLLAPIPQPFVEFLKRGNRGNGNKGVPAAVPDLVFHVALFIAGGRIAEIRLEPVVEHEPAKPLRKRPLAILQDLSNSSAHVVKPKVMRHSADVFKDSLHPFQQAFLILRRKSLRVPLVGVRERNGQCIAGLFLSVTVVVHELPEVRLPPAKRMVNGQITCLAGLHGVALLAHIPLDAGIAAGKATFIPKSGEYPLCRMPLLSRNLAIRFQPFIDSRYELPQDGITLRVDIGKVVLTSIFLVGVFLYCSEGMMRSSGNFSQA